MSSKKNSNEDKANSRKTLASDSTVCTQFTGSGRSAIAVIGVAGPDARCGVMQCFTAASSREMKPHEIRYGDWHGPKNRSGNPSATASIASESIVVILRHEALWEIHCHGGSAAIDRIMLDLNEVGITSVDHQDWPYPWFAATADSKPESRLVREATEVLTHCQTVRTAAVAMDQVRGAMHDWASRWLNVADRSAILRAADKSAGDDGTQDEGTPLDIDDLHREVQAILAYAAIGVRLTAPFRVVLSGRPNVGKSSLINAILGYDRSIATAMAGTTRDVLHAETVIDGLPIRLTDTAGIHDSGESIEREGISRAMREASAADLVLAIQTPDTPAIADPTSQVPRIDVLNKSDLLTTPPPETDWIQTIATTGEGIDRLLSEIANRLAGTFPPAKSPVPLNERQVRCLESLLDTSEPMRLAATLKELLDGPS
ncbi:GTPase [Novipirellula caenicola]|uniref:tRNA modification GTPase MnmE n=1 Tax=Novipirellula caenicola TaxID=1536901 RepID=A0ABP9W4Q0_9BACT